VASPRRAMTLRDLEVGLVPRGPDVLHVDLAHGNSQRIAGSAEDVGVIRAPDAIAARLGARQLLEGRRVAHGARGNPRMGTKRAHQVAGDGLGLLVVAAEGLDQTAPAPSRVISTLRGGWLHDPILDRAAAEREIGSLHDDPARSLLPRGNVELTGMVGELD